MTWIELRPCEVRWAQEVGVERNLIAREQGRQPLIPGSDTWTGDQRGALGELVVAKALGVWWEPNIGGNDHGHGDVGPWEVRSTNWKPYRLTIRGRDDDRLPFVLVTGVPYRLCIEGWLYAEEGKRPGYRQRDDGSGEVVFQVPAQALHPWEERPFI